MVFAGITVELEYEQVNKNDKNNDKLIMLLYCLKKFKRDIQPKLIIFRSLL